MSLIEKTLAVSTLMILFGVGEAMATQPLKDGRYKEVTLELKEGDRLAISALKGSVKLIPVAAGKPSVLRVRKSALNQDSVARFEATGFSVRKVGTILNIEMTGPDSKSSLAEWLKASPDLGFEIEAPAVPVEIALREGSVTLQGWKQPTTIAIIEGTVRSSDGALPLHVQIQKGDVRIEGHRGSVEIDSHAAKVSVQGVEGDLSLTNFAGETVLTDAKGNIDLRGGNGAMTVAKSSGNLDFFTGRGALNLNGFDGAVRGDLEQGSVAVEVLGEADVNITANQGSVSVKVPVDSGASVRLKTDEGTLAAPPVLKPVGGDARSVAGRLTGAGPRGVVAIRSKSGQIRLR